MKYVFVRAHQETYHAVCGNMSRIPMEYPMSKSQSTAHHHVSFSKTTLKHADKLLYSGRYSKGEVQRLIKSVDLLNSRFQKIYNNKEEIKIEMDCIILGPDGGVYDSSVQRLLVLSGCVKYDNKIRAIYYISQKPS